MKRILLVYGSRYGQTQKVARTLATHLENLQAEVSLVDVRDSQQCRQLNLSDYHSIVCGGSLIAGGTQKALLRFLRHNRAQLENRERHFFLVLLSAATEDPARRQAALDDARQKLEKQLPLRFPHIEMIAGALHYSRYSFPVRWMMKRIAASQGGDTDTTRDHEYTDWSQVEAFARHIIGPPEHSGESSSTH